MDQDSVCLLSGWYTFVGPYNEDLLLHSTRVIHFSHTFTVLVYQLYSSQHEAEDTSAANKVTFVNCFEGETEPFSTRLDTNYLIFFLH